MSLKPDTRRVLTGVAFCGFILAAAGCQSSDALDPGVAKTPPTAERITDAELRAYCPKVVLRDGSAFFNTYAKGARRAQPAEGEAEAAAPDPKTIMYQASIAEVTRSCTYAPGTMTMNVAVAGRVVPGPAGASGAITMPIRVVAMKGDEVLYSMLHQHQVTIPDSTTPVQFVFNDPNLVLPQATEYNYRVFAGFDDGSDGRKKTAAAQ